MPIVIVALGILILLLLVIRFKWNAFLALIVASLFVGFAQGMKGLQILKSMENGVGNTLGYLALILGLGGMLGALVAESGAAITITNSLIKSFGKRNIQWAVILTGFIVGISMFYTVGFVMLIPIIFAIAQTSGLPMLYVGIPMICSLSVTHGFLPPHPAPTAIAVIYHADISLTLLYGLALAIPTILIAGLWFGSRFKNFFTTPPDNLFKVKVAPENSPALWVSVLTALLPVLLMASAAAAKLALNENDRIYEIISFLGEPVVALVLAVLVGIYTLGISLGKGMKEVMNEMVNSVKSLAIIILIIGAGGAFKQVLIDSGISVYVVDVLSGVNIPPLVITWLIAAALRISLGSATVAALTAAGIATPLIASSHVSPELLVLATGAGSLTFSNVNDTGFWLFKEYFNLSIAQTFKSWTVMETLVSLIGLGGCLILERIIQT